MIQEKLFTIRLNEAENFIYKGFSNTGRFVNNAEFEMKTDYKIELNMRVEAIRNSDDVVQ